MTFTGFSSHSKSLSQEMSKNHDLLKKLGQLASENMDLKELIQIMEQNENHLKDEFEILKTKLDEAIKENFELKIQLESKMSKTEVFSIKSSTGSDADDQPDSELGESFKLVMDFFETKTEPSKIDEMEKSPSKIVRAESKPDTKPVFTNSNSSKNSLNVKALPESSQNLNKKRKRKKSGKTAANNEKSKAKPLQIWGLTRAENLPKPGTAISGLKI